MSRFDVAEQEIGAETGSLADPVVDDMVFDKGAAPFLDSDQTLIGKRGDGPPYGMPIDAEASRQQAFRWELPAGAVNVTRYLLTKDFRDLVPERDCAAAVEFHRRSS